MLFDYKTLNVKRQENTSSSGLYGLNASLDIKLSTTVVQAPVHVAPAPPPLLRVEPSEWQYTDPQGQVQGPFEQENMRQWHEAGYFNGDLPIKMRHWQRFHPFQEVFPDFKIAFLNVPQEPGSSMLLSMQQQQQQQQQLLLQQQQALLRQQEEQRKEQERIAAAEAQRRIAQMEAEKLAQQQRQAELLRQQQLAIQQQQQQQQQMILQQQQAEMEAQKRLLEQKRQQAAAAATQAQPAPSPVKAAPVAPWANKVPGANRNQDLTAIQNEEAAARETERRKAAAEQAKISKGWAAPANNGSALSLAEIQQQEEAQRQAAEAARVSAAAAAPATTNMSSQLKNLLGVKSVTAPATVSTGSAWGSVAAPAQSKSSASLRDIMEQETSTSGEAVQGASGTSAPAPARKGSSWAAKAGSTTFSAPEPVLIAPKRAVVPAPAPIAQAAASSTVASVAPRAASKPAPSNSKEKSSFGGKEMSAEMTTWCAAQLKRINGSDDLTLLHFCMSLDSAADIREYLSEYLGSSPAVSFFAHKDILYRLLI